MGFRAQLIEGFAGLAFTPFPLMRKGNRRISQHRRARIRGDRCEKSRGAAPRPAT